MAQAKTYQCPRCNGVMSFDAATGHITCEFCGYVLEDENVQASIPVSDAPVEQHATTHATSVEDFLERAPWEVTADGSVNAVVYTCPSCAAEVAADQSTVSTMCPYCGNNMLVSGTATSDNIPKYVMPFAVTREQAEERMREHFKHKWYLSRKFDASLEHMQGMYVPYHLYDMNVRGWANYVGYEEESYTDADGDTHTRKYYYAVKRAGRASFTQVPVDGSSKMPDGHMDAIAPFDFNKMVDFSAGYAAGYLMEVADEDADECLPRAQNRVRNSFEEDLKADARRERGVDGIEEVAAHHTDVTLQRVTSAVLPVWLMHCTWSDNQMLFAVNGDTGKCVGDLPVETKRRVATVASTLLAMVAAAVILFFAVLDGSDNELEFMLGAAFATILVTVLVDGHFMSQMRTAVEATNAGMSYDSEGLVVTDRWRSRRRTSSRNKARRWLEQS